MKHFQFQILAQISGRNVFMLWLRPRTIPSQTTINFPLVGKPMTGFLNRNIRR
jgi:hypothetical protein